MGRMKKRAAPGQSKTRYGPVELQLPLWARSDSLGRDSVQVPDSAPARKEKWLHPLAQQR